MTFAEIEITPGLLRRFWAKVEKLGNESGCWLWTGGCTKTGYGNFWPTQHFHLGAHRMSWVIKNGPDPNLFVCHKCDTPSCVNPDHLFLGDHVANAIDSFQKGRGQEGERHYAAKLKEADVREIRRLYAGNGISQDEIAKMFGVGQMTISNIITRKSWKSIL